MAQHNALYGRAQTAEELTQRLLKAAAYAIPGVQVQIYVQTNLTSLALNVQGPTDQLPTKKELTEFLNQVKGRSHVTAVSGKAVIAGQETGIHYKSTDGVIGEFSLNVQNEPARALRMLEAVEQHFQVTSYIDIVRTVSPAVDQAAIQLRERSVADLHETVQKLAAFLANLAQQEVEHRKKLQEELEKSLRERNDALEKDFRERQAALDKRKAEQEEDLVRRANEHNQRVASFNTHEAKYVRRELLKTIQDTIAEIETLRLSGTTGRKRWWIHGFVWVLLLASGAIAFSMGIKAYSQTDWRFLVSCSGGFLTFVATMVYYLKWNDRWFREHADGELAAKRYKADILRASWLAELMSEWAKEGKGELPEQLISAYTRNLFTGIDSSRVNDHPMDHLTAIMKRATEFDIGKGVFSVRGYKPEKAAPKSP